MKLKRQTIRRSVLFCSFAFFQFSKFFHLLLSPVLIIAAASQGIMNGSFILYIVLILSSLFWGRAFCGWVCPGGGAQELCALFVHKKAGLGKKLWIKYFIFSLWSLAIVAVLIHRGGIRSVDFFFGMQESNRVQSLFLFWGALLLIVPMSLGFGKWALCHYVCWLAPFMIFGTWLKDRFGWPSLRLKVRSGGCTGCHLCDRDCPMSLPVSFLVQKQTMAHPECILCGTCVDHCPSKVIYYSFSAS